MNGVQLHEAKPSESPEGFASLGFTPHDARFPMFPQPATSPNGPLHGRFVARGAARSREIRRGHADERNR